MVIDETTKTLAHPRRAQGRINPRLPSWPRGIGVLTEAPRERRRALDVMSVKRKVSVSMAGAKGSARDATGGRGVDQVSFWAQIGMGAQGSLLTRIDLGWATTDRALELICGVAAADVGDVAALSRNWLHQRTPRRDKPSYEEITGSLPEENASLRPFTAVPRHRETSPRVIQPNVKMAWAEV